MRKLLLILLVILLAGCGQTENISVIEKNKNEEVQLKDNLNPEQFIEGLYIGEAFSNGKVYIENFSVDRDTFNKKSETEYLKNEIQFLSLDKEKVILCNFLNTFEYYVPDQESESTYFYQGYSTPIQYGYVYSSNKGDNRFLGIAHLEYTLTHFNNKIRGNKRKYSEAEFEEAQKLIEEDQSIEESFRVLDELDDQGTIIGAEHICSFDIQDTDYKMILSKYYTHSFEYLAEVYVIDLMLNDELVETFYKHNWDGPL